MISVDKIKNRLGSLDWGILVFLILLMNVSVKLKLIGVIFLCIYNYSLKIKTYYKIPKFYLVMIVFSFFQFLIELNFFETDVLIKKTLSIGYWTFSLVVIYQLAGLIKNRDTQKIKNSLDVFFILNILFSFFNLAVIIFKIGDINPFTFTGNNFQYHMSTGDYIKGISFDASSTNAFISLFGFIYYTTNRKYLLGIISFIVLLFTNSNMVNMILLTMLIILFFQRGRFIKSLVVCFTGIIVVFYTQISPQASAYIMNNFDSEYSVKLHHKKEAFEKNKILEQNRKDSIIRCYYPKSKMVNSNIKTSVKKNQFVTSPIYVDSLFDNKLGVQSNFISDFINKNYGGNIELNDSLKAIKIPGKLLSYYQTIQLSFSGVKKFLIGSGAGNFSSKLAFKLSGIIDMNIDGVRGTKINEDFKNNHLEIYCHYFSLDKAEHSAMNLPNSSFNQILGEYGFIGIILFILFYLLFFLKRFRELSYGKYLILVIFQALFIDYWFEQLSVVILFELLILLDLKNSQTS
jgi:hypothetical protein